MGIKLPKEFFKSQERVTKLDLAISKAIDKVCKEEDFKVTYAEIRESMYRILGHHNQLELNEERGLKNGEES